MKNPETVTLEDVKTGEIKKLLHQFTRRVNYRSLVPNDYELEWKGLERYI